MPGYLKCDVSRFKRCNAGIKCWNKIILLIGKINHLSSKFNNIIKEVFKWLNPLSAQIALTLICLDVFIAFPIILRKILSRNFVFNDLGSCQDDTVSLDFFIFIKLLFVFIFLTWRGVQMYTRNVVPLF